MKKRIKEYVGTCPARRENARCATAGGLALVRNNVLICKKNNVFNVLLGNGRRPSFAKATADRQAPPLQKCISLLVCISVFLFLCTPSALAASARQLPASYNESTYGDGTRDYTSLATWEAATDNNLVSAASGEVLTCYDDSAPYNDSVVLAGATTSSSYFRVIRAASGQRGTPTSGVRFEKVVTATTILFQISENYSGVYDIGVKLTSSNSSVCYGFHSPYNYTKFVGDTVYDYNTGAAAIGFRLAGTSVYAVNCVAKNITGGNNYTGGFVAGDNGTNTTTYIYNCTSINNEGTGAIVGYGICLVYPGSGHTTTVYTKNNLVQNNETNIGTFGTGGTLNHYQTTNTTSGVTFDADRYHLASTDTGAINQGTDLSGDGNFAFDDDIDEDTRSGTWDIGADEYYVAPASSPPPVIIRGTESFNIRSGGMTIRS